MTINFSANTGANQAGRWTKGQSGNPAGKPKGTLHKATRAAMALLDGEAEALTRRAIDLALGGDTMALRFCLERIVPPRKDAPITLELPSINSTADLVQATSAVAEATASGTITPTEGKSLTDILAVLGKNIELHELDARLSKLEQQQERKTK